MGVILTIHADGTLEGLEEARAHLVASPTARAACRRLIECAVAHGNATRDRVTPGNTCRSGGETPSKPAIYPASSAMKNAMNAEGAAPIPTKNCASSKSKRKPAPPISNSKSTRKKSRCPTSPNAPVPASNTAM